MAKIKRPVEPKIPWQARTMLMPDGVAINSLVAVGTDGHIYLTQAGVDAREKYRADLQAWEASATGKDAKDLYGYTNSDNFRLSGRTRCASCKHYAASDATRGRCELGQFAVKAIGTCRRVEKR